MRVKMQRRRSIPPPPRDGRGEVRPPRRSVLSGTRVGDNQYVVKVQMFYFQTNILTSLVR